VLSLSYLNLSKLVNLLTSDPCFQFLHIVVFRLPLLSSRPSLTSCLKIANRSCYHSAPVLLNNLPSHLRQVVHHITSSPILNSPVSDLSTSLFLKEFENPSLSLFVSSLVCIHPGYLRTDISGIDQASSFHLTNISHASQSHYNYIVSIHNILSYMTHVLMLWDKCHT